MEVREMCSGVRRLREPAVVATQKKQRRGCGLQHVTYWCGCLDAACAGVRVVRIGACEVGNGGSGLVSGQAFLLIHIIWLIILGFSLLCGLL
ncbi:hypothetical protein KSP40_PGU004367 [Platanthera guangdongensis]|uniref:Uncharacterized protein n=1 Tax=Platanthera guangdongensis TaxID=2320717 RepID=A0ABR2ME64_9ASPA